MGDCDNISMLALNIQGFFMPQFTPFNNDTQSLTIGDFTLENQGEQLNLYGSLTLTIDKQSLAYAKQLQVMLTQAVAYLEAHQAKTVEKTDIIARQQAQIEPVNNPFA